MVIGERVEGRGARWEEGGDVLLLAGLDNPAEVEGESVIFRNAEATALLQREEYIQTGIETGVNVASERKDVEKGGRGVRSTSPCPCFLDFRDGAGDGMADVVTEIAVVNGSEKVIWRGEVGIERLEKVGGLGLLRFRAIV